MTEKVHAQPVKELYSLFHKPWRMFIVSRPIRCDMKPQKITAKPQHWLVTTWHKTTSWPFLLQEIFNFTISNTEIYLSRFRLWYPQRIDVNGILRKSDVKSRRQDQSIRRSDLARQRIWEREKMSQSQAMFLFVCFMCSSKGHVSWLWLVVFDLYFL